MPTWLDLASIPQRGLIGSQSNRFGDTGAGFNGYATITHSTTDQMVNANWTAQFNRDTLYGRMGLDCRIGPQRCRGNIAHERRGVVRDLQSDGEFFVMTDAIRVARQAKGATNLRAIESLDYAGYVYNVEAPPGLVPFLTPRVSQAWAEEKTYRRLMSVEDARDALSRCNDTGELNQAANILRRPGIIAGTNIVEGLADAHQMPIGDKLTRRRWQSKEASAQLGNWNSFLRASMFGFRRCSTDAETKSDDAAEVMHTKEHESGWKSDFIVMLGLRGFRRNVEADSYREIRDYARTPESVAALRGADDCFEKSQLPDMSRADVLGRYNATQGTSAKGVQLTGLMRAIETFSEWSMTWRLQLLTARPGFWTIIGKDCYRGEKREFAVNADPQGPQIVERFINTRRNTSEWFGGRPTVREVIATEEWSPEHAGQKAKFQRLRLVSKWHARAPQTPETLNKVIAHYNKLFDADYALLDAGPHGVSASRRIKIDAELTAGDIAKLHGRLVAHADLARLASQTSIALEDLQRFVRSFENAATLKGRCTLLREFVAQYGVRAIALLNRLIDVPPAALEISADEGAYDGVIAHCGKLHLRYPPGLDGSQTLPMVEARLSHATRALQLLQRARLAVSQDTMIPEIKRCEKLARLNEEEGKIRKLYEVRGRSSKEKRRTRLHHKLTNRWFMTAQECEYAAVFQSVSDIDVTFTQPVNNPQSAAAYLRHYDEVKQALRRIESGTTRNILFTPAERAHHLGEVHKALRDLEGDFARRRDRDMQQGGRYLGRPWATCGWFWFASWRGWRFFWQTI